MPFRPYSLPDLPAGKPDVKIFFHGQLLLRSLDGTNCEVGVNTRATDHVLFVEVRTKTPGQLDLINMKHVGPLNFRQPEGMTIEITENEDDAAPPPAAFKCVMPLDQPDYEQGVGVPDEDFRWMLNLEGRLFHEQPLNPIVFGTQNVIKLQGGQYYFRTALRVDKQIEFKRRDGERRPKTIKGIGAIASASVFLVEDQSIVLRWDDGRKERVLTLTKSEESTYEIYIENTPLFEDVEPVGLSKHDELAEFYKVIPEIPSTTTGARFSLVPGMSASALGAGSDAGSPSVPCQAMILDGPLT